jgi:hypothetical protein
VSSCMREVRARGTCLSGRMSLSPRHLSKWSHVLVPATLVQVVARPCFRDTCLSGRTSSSPAALVQSGRVSLPSLSAHLLKWSPAPVLVFGTYLYGDASGPALTRTVTYHRCSLVILWLNSERVLRASARHDLTRSHTSNEFIIIIIIEPPPAHRY